MLLALVAGCSGGASGSSSVSTPGASLTGPWAAEFQAAIAGSSDEFVKSALTDGEVSDAEMAEGNSRYRACLEDAGFTEIDIGEKGAESMVFPPTVSDEVGEQMRTECDVSTGRSDLLVLYVLPRDNPNNEDTAQLMVDCIVRMGLREEGYTVDEYFREVEADVYDQYFGEGEAARRFMACNDDPVNAQPGSE
jgi:hypothetical protein